MIKAKKNYLSCNEKIIKAMYKRRKLAAASICMIYDTKQELKIVK